MVHSLIRYLRSWFGRRGVAPRDSTPPLTGAPLHPRLKTYSSDGGFVYQYVFRGQRRAPEGAGFVFSVTIDRKNWYPLEVLLPQAMTEEWQAAASAELRHADRYAVAKLRLFQLFDEAEPIAGAMHVAVTLEEMRAALTTLGLYEE